MFVYTFGVETALQAKKANKDQHSEYWRVLVSKSKNQFVVGGFGIYESE